jgi:hypothetical protein
LLEIVSQQCYNTCMKNRTNRNLVFCFIDLLSYDCHCEESDDEAIPAKHGFLLVEIASLRSQ